MSGNLCGNTGHVSSGGLRLEIVFRVERRPTASEDENEARDDTFLTKRFGFSAMSGAIPVSALYAFAASFTHASLSVMVRLNTSPSGVLSVSRQKYARRSN